MGIRFLDFGVSGSQSVSIGAVRYLGWPVHAYRITLPRGVMTPGLRLNPFEKVILDLLESSGNIDTATLAQETCLPHDLVRSVVLILREKGLVDDNNVVIRNLEPFAFGQQNSSFGTAVVFRELVGGEILPFVHLTDDETVLITDDKYVHHIMQGTDQAKSQEAPSPRQVISAIVAMKQRLAEHGQKFRAPTVEEVRVMRQPEEHFLYCPIAIERSSSDFRISDPFGVGYSRVLERSYSDCLKTGSKTKEWHLDWLKSLSSTDRARSRNGKTTDAALGPESVGLFPELLAALSPPRGVTFRPASAIYAALEWAIFHSCEMNDPERAIKRITGIPIHEHPEFLARISASIGLSVPPPGFHRIANGKLLDFRKRRPEMETVLAIAIVQAESDLQHPLRLVAEKFPGLVQEMRSLGTYKARELHGRNQEFRDEIELVADAMMREVVSILIPSIRFNEEATVIDPDDQADLRLLARTRIIEAIGYEAFERIGPSARQSLLNAEQFLCECDDDDDARAFVSDLYSGFQAVLRRFLPTFSSVDLSDSELVRQAEERSHRCGLGALPASLRSVNTRRIRSALSGMDPTLGSLVLAILLTADESVLEEVGVVQGNFLELIGEILELRGHANEPIVMKTSAAIHLRTVVTNSLVTLSALRP